MKLRFGFGLLAVTLGVAACSTTNESVGMRVAPSATSFTSQTAEAVTGSFKKTPPSFILTNGAASQRTDLRRRRNVVPLSLTGGTVDKCTEPDNGGYFCIVQGTEQDGYSETIPAEPSGATITYSAPNVTDGLTVTPATYTTSTPPYQYVFNVQTANNAIIGNNFTFKINITVAGSSSFCQENFCGNDPAVWYFQNSCSEDLGQCPRVQIYDSDLNKVVSASPVPSTLTATVVGQQQNLAHQYVPNSGPAPTYSPSNLSWMVQGGPISNYALGQVTSPTQAPSPIPVPTNFGQGKPSLPGFYWLNPQTDQVNVNVELVGQLGANGYEDALTSAQGNYNVQAPTNIVLGAGVYGSPTTYVATDDGISLAYVAAGNGTSSLGMQYNFSATSPSGFSGSYDATQLINTCSSYVRSGTTYYDSSNTHNSYYLDNFSLYPPSPSPNWSSNDTPTTGEMNTGALTKLTRTDSVRTFYIFKPNGAGSGAGHSVWVPLGNSSWGWSATAIRPTGSSSLRLSAESVATPSATIAVGVAPTWSAINLNSTPAPNHTQTPDGTAFNC